MDMDSNLKDMLLSVPETAESPSPAVWEDVRRSLKRRDFWRVKGKILLSAGLLAVACGALLLLVPPSNVPDEEVPGMESVAEVTEGTVVSGKTDVSDTAQQPVKAETPASVQAFVPAVPAARPVEVRAEAVTGTHPELLPQSAPGKTETAATARLEEKIPAASRQQVTVAIPAVKAETLPAETEKAQPKAVDTPAFRVIFPSAFTPNGDGLNDTYAPLISESVSRYVMRIYNRSNQLVFQTLHPEESWDGTFRGQLQPHGAYVCVVSCTTASGQHASKSEFLLLRD